MDAIKKNKFYVTTPIYYVTARPHLGSLYSTLLADVTARWNKLKGKKAFFLTGTDEHGQKVAQAAHAADKDPKPFVDSFIPAYKEVWKKYHLDYDCFIRTTDTYHVQAVQDWIRALIAKGDIYKSFYQGWYCTHCETFLTEKEYEHLSSDQVPPCPSCNRPTAIVAEECYFFKLSAYQEKLLAFYEENPDFVVPKERLKEVINFVQGGLKDLSISRTTVTWGIPFPGDEKHVAYVWADALNNYITAIGYGQKGRQEEFNFWWPADLQILGKDILRFHAIYWPAFLMASDLPLPKKLLVHGWITVDKQKMSKSLGNVIDPMALSETYGVDAVRYYLLRQIAINTDGDFSIEDLENRIGADLANDLGNLLNRMVALAEKNNLTTVELVLPLSGRSKIIMDESHAVVADFNAQMENYSFHLAMARLWKFISQVNAYFHEQEPWKLAKSDQHLFKEVIAVTAASLELVALQLWPVMPDKMEELLRSLGKTIEIEVGKNCVAHSVAQEIKSYTLKKGNTLFIKPEPKFEEPAVLEKNVEQIEYPIIGIEDFAKVHLVVGTIEDAQEVEGSDKLLKLHVNLAAYGQRTILSGIRKSNQPADLIGKQAIFVVNFKPRKMMGLESQGMMLSAPDADGMLKIATVIVPVPNGTRIG